MDPAISPGGRLAAELAPGIVAVQAACARHPEIGRLWVFGSAVRADFTPQSDVDMIVEFDPEAHVSLLGLERLQTEFAALLQRAVDLLTWPEIHPLIQPRVRREAVQVYERAA